MMFFNKLSVCYVEINFTLCIYYIYILFHFWNFSFLRKEPELLEMWLNFVRLDHWLKFFFYWFNVTPISFFYFLYLQYVRIQPQLLVLRGKTQDASSNISWFEYFMIIILETYIFCAEFPDFVFPITGKMFLNCFGHI